MDLKKIPLIITEAFLLEMVEDLVDAAVDHGSAYKLQWEIEAGLSKTERDLEKADTKLRNAIKMIFEAH